MMNAQQRKERTRDVGGGSELDGEHDGDGEERHGNREEGRGRARNGPGGRIYTRWIRLNDEGKQLISDSDLNHLSILRCFRPSNYVIRASAVHLPKRAASTVHATPTSRQPTSSQAARSKWRSLRRHLQVQSSGPVKINDHHRHLLVTGGDWSTLILLLLFLLSS